MYFLISILLFLAMNAAIIILIAWLKPFIKALINCGNTPAEFNDAPASVEILEINNICSVNANVIKTLSKLQIKGLKNTFLKKENLILNISLNFGIKSGEVFKI